MKNLGIIDSLICINTTYMERYKYFKKKKEKDIYKTNIRNFKKYLNGKIYRGFKTGEFRPTTYITEDVEINSELIMYSLSRKFGRDIDFELVDKNNKRSAIKFTIIERYY